MLPEDALVEALLLVSEWIFKSKRSIDGFVCTCLTSRSAKMKVCVPCCFCILHLVMKQFGDLHYAHKSSLKLYFSVWSTSDLRCYAGSHHSLTWARCYKNYLEEFMMKMGSK